MVSIELDARLEDLPLAGLRRRGRADEHCPRRRLR
jgi:hypothetical protein